MLQTFVALARATLSIKEPAATDKPEVKEEHEVTVGSSRLAFACDCARVLRASQDAEYRLRCDSSSDGATAHCALRAFVASFLRFRRMLRMSLGERGPLTVQPRVNSHSALVEQTLRVLRCV